MADEVCKSSKDQHPCTLYLSYIYPVRGMCCTRKYGYYKLRIGHIRSHHSTSFHICRWYRLNHHPYTYPHFQNCFHNLLFGNHIDHSSLLRDIENCRGNLCNVHCYKNDPFCSLYLSYNFAILQGCMFHLRKSFRSYNHAIGGSGID